MVVKKNISTDTAALEALRNQLSNGNIPVMQEIRLRKDYVTETDSFMELGSFYAVTGILDNGKWILIGRDGDVLCVWISTDKGDSWTKKVAFNSAATSLQAGGVVGDRIIAFFSQSDQTGYIYSDNEGDTWSAFVQIPNIAVSGLTPTRPYSNQQFSIMDNGNIIQALWITISGRRILSYTESSDNGATWDDPNNHIIYRSDEDGISLNEWMMVDAGSGNYIAMCRNSSEIAGNNSVYQIESHDYGQTWGSPSETSIQAVGILSTGGDTDDVGCFPFVCKTVDGHLEFWNTDRTDMSLFVHRCKPVDVINTPMGWPKGKRYLAYMPDPDDLTPGYINMAFDADGNGFMSIRVNSDHMGNLAIIKLSRNYAYDYDALRISKPIKSLRPKYNNYNVDKILVRKFDTPNLALTSVYQKSLIVSVSGAIAAAYGHGSIDELFYNNGMQPLYVYAIVKVTHGTSTNYNTQIGYINSGASDVIISSDKDGTAGVFVKHAMSRLYYLNGHNVYRFFVNSKVNSGEGTLDYVEFVLGCNNL